MKVLALVCCLVAVARSLPAQEQEERSATNKVYAFTAEVSQEKEINSDITMVFGKTLANFGNQYSPAYGQFVCPDDAVYVFLWSTTNMKGTSKRNTLVLQKTGQDVKYGPKTSAHGSKTGGVATMLAVTNCRTNPPTAISVKTKQQAVYDDVFSSFSGFRLAGMNNAIAFTAEITHNQQIFPDQRLRFDRVLHNYGNGYNKMHGYFRCPDNGVYGFFVSTQSLHDSSAQWSRSALMRHGQKVMDGPETYRATGAADSGSSSILATLQCERGQDIYVQTEESYKFKYNNYGSVLTTFSGFKLFNEYSSAAVAFSAVLSKDHIYHTVDATLLFDRVITNIGEAYVPLVGFFICPDAEVYLFSWSAVSNIGGSNLDLYLDDKVVKSNVFNVQSSSVAYGDSGTSTMATILKCQPMSRVHVRSTVATTLKNTVYLAGLTSFSGFKIPSDYYN